MRAIGYRTPGDPDVLEDVELPEPDVGPRDLLVEVRAVSVNPVDTKVRRRQGAPEGSSHQVLGWDAAGVVLEAGPEVTSFAVGDEVWYAGSLTRAGANSERHVVDERIAARKPASLDFAQAAALPLTTITAWELLFDRLGVPRTEARDGGAGQTLLVVGAAGGVGSVLVQLAARLTGLRVVATASRPETRQWVTRLGADDVVDHREPLSEALRAEGVDSVDLVAALTHTEDHFEEIAEAVAPQGRVAVIDDPAHLDVTLLKRKSASLHWEFMFTRSMFETADVEEQGRLLAEVAALVDDGTIRTTTDSVHGEISAATLRSAHAFVERGRAIGKVVLAEWPQVQQSSRTES